MKVFKFGGASVKDAESVKNVANVLGYFPGEEILIVVSAMGKTTNALEELVQKFYNGKEGCSDIITKIKQDHFAIIDELFPSDEHRVHNDIEILITQLQIITQGTPEGNFNQVYDQIVSFGELISTKIVSSYLNSSGYQNKWLDARRLIRTDQNFRFARVDWSFTERMVKDTIKPGNRYVIQGFIGSDDDLNPTTLGREGSDYTASVLGYVLGAEEVVIWKDVPGVLNGDPKVFDNVELLNEISYREAIELAYYGASVIHPKTIQPLQKKLIPLRVKSFVNPSEVGTLIREGSDLSPFLPCFIKKDNQTLITISTRDLAFIVEDHLSMIYKTLHQFGVRVNMTQNTAISSSFCINNDPITVPKLIEELGKDFDITYNEGVNLYSVRHYDDDAVSRVKKSGEILLEQISRNTYQVVTI
ncbi:aspartate kinase [Owenweeksia hongkongensis]|uniref:aspartate kinase n=1 Tax=Owenweeksia hongkongensis TaxID=253245 RepID=UPI003A8D9EC1